MSRSFSFYRSKGLSLVELLVAMALSLIIGAAVIQMFLASKSSHRLQDSMARVQENGRFAVGFLAKDIRMAGFMGCGNIDEIAINVIANPAPIDVANPLGQIIGGVNNIAATNSWNAVAGTDVLSIRKASNAGVGLVGNMSTDNANIQIETNTLELVAGDALFISDCLSADIFRATNVSSGSSHETIAHANNYNTSNRLSKAYGDDAELFAFESIDYFIRDTGRATASGDPIRALWVTKKFANRSDASANPVELVEGVQDMQIEYGVATGASMIANSYQTANNVTDWSKVVSVRFSLLMQSTEGNVVGSGAAAQQLTFNGAAVPADGRLRQVFGSAVAIRNRVR
ncbi:hypothetical protein BZL41_03670 [Pseudomonas sp. PIC25]|uniref:PilW family protein n=1 Tax=Pseudomonas sp. PIC25 TaxID=1958773 RepID=UPI000BAB3072|nr:PilW family protein [Pseudomonas sp. PIC25]PAU66042.1 hypothetical protein BZL41_03670 [Pseudomonas sp. PIC25]